MSIRLSAALYFVGIVGASIVWDDPRAVAEDRYYAVGEDVAAPTKDDDQLVSHSNNERTSAATCDCGCDALAEDGCCCSCKKMKALAGKVKSAYKPLFYDNDFSYLCDPCYDGYHLGDELKRMCVGNCWQVDVGGEYRFRLHNEGNLRAKPLSGVNDDFFLHRTRLYVNAETSDRFRLYVEAIDATSAGQRNTPRGIEVNRADLINAFGDLKLLENDCRDSLWVRAGRQELLYGVQRLVSPLDWSNTRRTFDGVKMFYKSQDWNVDGWWSKPIPFGQHIAGGRQDHNFDRSNEDQNFVGLYATYKGSPGRTYDMFFLRLDDNSGTLTNANARPGDADWNLIAGRMAGANCDWSYEFEGGVQFGEFGPDSTTAGYFTLGLGRKFECAPWQPTLWLWYDWASGDQNPTDGKVNTFNQYYPLGHKYLGFMDIVGRQNIQDLNLQLVMKPHEKLKFIVWYHRFWLQSDTDALYNAGGAPIYQDPTGGSGNDIGQEIDLALNWSITPRMNLLFGYSHFWTGDFFDSAVIQTAATPAGGIASNGADGNDADFFYTQFHVRF